ncbi:30S ribosomal protein S18 [Pseudonocardia yuanmonensis]|uniref:30S ribosomal protein S18 n=1 Tax=Pseudonocardia yuanmonensis TaxID=1095914 RepID=A0ABP8XHP2_9PSEU
MRPVRPLRKKVDPLHARGLTEVDWKDTALHADLRLRPRQDPGSHAIERARSRSAQHGRSGLTPQQQRQVAVAIRNAREMALLPSPNAGRG